MAKTVKLEKDVVYHGKFLTNEQKNTPGVSYTYHWPDVTAKDHIELGKGEYVPANDSIVKPTEETPTV